MVRRFGQILFILVLVCLPQLAPAGCPSMGGMDGTCASDSSSIESCTNSIWEDYQEIKFTIAGLQTSPQDPSGRLANIVAAKSRLMSKIGLLGSALTYKRKPIFSDCDTTFHPGLRAIDGCKTQLRSALNGMSLLSKKEVVENLSMSNRARLRLAYMKQATQYRNELDVLAASWTGDPSVLCNETYASASACRRAVEMDADALSRRVFSVYRCGQIVPGKFVSAASEAEDGAVHANAASLDRTMWRMMTFPYSYTVRFYQDRLTKEKSLLSQALQAH